MRKISKKYQIMMALFIIILPTLFLISCNDQGKTMKDREGNDFKAPKKVERIISTAPSNTEILVGLGLGNKIVATDTYSEDVIGVNKDVTRIDPMKPDAETIVSLKPDLVIASGHNKGEGNDPFSAIKEAGIPVVYIPSSTSIEGIYSDINFLGELTNTAPEAEEIIKSMKNEIKKIKDIGNNIKDKKSVYFEIGPAPTLYSFGNGTFLNEMIDIIGAKNIFYNEKGWISPSAEAVVEKNPDVILTNVNYIKDPIKEIKSRNGWNTISAIKNNAVYQIDTNSSSRPSQHIIKALKEMAKDIYPEEYKNE